MIKRFLHFPAIALLLTACSGNHTGWTVTGELPEGVKRVVLEKPSPAGGWYAADSIVISNDKEKRFTMAREEGHSEMYRLKIDGKYIYVPADSTETIEISMSPENMWVLSGSHEAELFNKVNSILAQTPDSSTQRRLLLALQNDFGSTAAYYANLRLNGGNKTLLRAVANAYAVNRPEDPRTALLLSALKGVTNSQQTNETVVIEAPELGYFDIELLNRKGEVTSLSSVVDAHQVTLLAFVNMASETTPAVNISIGEAYTAYPQIGIYEVGFGENQHQWADATAELPWVNVFQSESASRVHLGQYAVSQIPTFFIIANGEIVERIEDPAKIKETVRKYL